MKGKTAVILACFFLFLNRAAAQEQGAGNYVERKAGGLYSFYYDSQYFLTGHDCEFFYIERVTGYDVSLKAFDGPFTDYDPDGNILLTGAYEHGKKNGVFKSFYPGGYLRWEAIFTSGIPSGTWYYYFPDGRPQSILNVNGGNVRITNAWNEKGKQVIKNGAGSFELTDPQFGFNEKGYNSISYKGKVKGGIPDGEWRIYFEYNNSRQLAAVETFKNQSFLGGVLLETGQAYKSSRIRFVPTEPFYNAESFISKNCNIDDYYNYTSYLTEYLNRSFSGITVDLSIEETIEFTIDVDASGNPSRFALVKGDNREIISDKMLQLAVSSIPFWIPSQKDGRPVKDKLTVSTLMTGDAGAEIYFSNTRIKRAFGN